MVKSSQIESVRNTVFMYCTFHGTHALVWVHCGLHLCYIAAVTYYAISVPFRLVDTTRRLDVYFPADALCAIVVALYWAFVFSRWSLAVWCTMRYPRFLSLLHGIASMPTEIVIAFLSRGVWDFLMLSRLVGLAALAPSIAAFPNSFYEVQPYAQRTVVSMHSRWLPRVRGILRLVMYVHWPTCAWLGVRQHRGSYLESLADITCVVTFSCGQSVRLVSEEEHIFMSAMYVGALVCAGAIAAAMYPFLRRAASLIIMHINVAECYRALTAMGAPYSLKAEVACAVREAESSRLWRPRGSEVEYPPNIERVLEYYRVMCSLESHPMCAGIGRGLLEQLAERCRDVTFEEGARMVKHGEVGDCVYLILSGTVKITTPQGNVLGTITTPSIIGEISVLTGVPRIASVVCESFVDAICMPKDAFERARQHTAFRLALGDVVAKRFALHEVRCSGPVVPDPSEEGSVSIDPTMLAMFDRNMSETLSLALQGSQGNVSPTTARSPATGGGVTVTTPQNAAAAVAATSAFAEAVESLDERLVRGMMPDFGSEVESVSVRSTATFSTHSATCAGKITRLIMETNSQLTHVVSQFKERYRGRIPQAPPHVPVVQTRPPPLTNFTFS